ncbi:hypothetical protein A3F00_04730 [Candidatus Daviesbacteria bacterium RIFCSPHIGHO2_12_FULL_37_11]|uniref:Glycosyltransferase RgtA/B/C/D-like domain-containing protein n=1 Tax=Candidatus Daviesbacteria bacterium RIFCSPHIGHO2_12_FULL_37_11 TaxID=1797777 RepID=A0A1F5KB82_9BACT|nr:MAG: hypothetical protein A3F00_04730 [Candidatus Daviesbacteria bacterium RIFCSPHIGHO2_12_FULL_37_11]OGE44928.1 MAG: hypothetical protein A3B39_02420 [Candidatus Daviesbacteria bacterium RIFCSPLOWO2_01_FULL_37_10]
MKKIFVIFILALFLRFLYFPDNIYFGFDAARDGFAVQEILKGDIKIVGPSTSVPGLFHGVLYYYILSPLYFSGNLNPEFVSAALRIFNALGIFLVYFIGSTIFERRVGFIGALIFASSFEQTQFAMYMGNPTLAVLSVLILYTGLSMVIFRNNRFGLPLASLGLGFSIQLQFALLYLCIPFVLIILIFRSYFVKLPIKIWSASLVVLFISLSSFVLAEFKYGFRTINTLSSVGEAEKEIANIFNTYFFTVFRMGSFNITGELLPTGIVLIFLFFVFLILVKNKKYRKEMIFLGLWFFSILTTFLMSGGISNLNGNTPLYYPNVGVSIALILFTSFLISSVYRFNKFVGIILILIILLGNFQLIQKFNPKGTISEITVQQGMLLSDEKKVLDYMYNDSDGHVFAVKGVTMPFYINTTWSYLFEWYGKKTYGYIPVWNGKNAEGFYGNLKVLEAQEDLPTLRYLIIEPVRGVPKYLIDEYLKEENYFTKVVDERKIGEFVVQKREKF